MDALDTTDIGLLVALQKDSKQSIKQLAEKVNLTITPVHERVKKLENLGLIDKYVAIVNPRKLGKKLVVYCQVTLLKHQEEVLADFEHYIQSQNEVLEASYIAGTYDFLLKVVLKDMDDYQRFILEKVSKLEMVTNIQSSFVIKNIKNTTLIIP